MAELEDTTVEVWRQVAMAPRYFVSSKGRVVGPKWVVLRPSRDRGGYPQVNLYIVGGSKQVTRKIHRLMAIAFFGEPTAERPHVNHKNSVRDDNRVENLEWCSISENNAHGFRAGLHEPHHGERSGMAKLTNEQVLQIRQRKASGESTSTLAREYGVREPCILRIHHRQRWAHLP